MKTKQDPRITKMMAARRAELRKVARSYPKFKPGMTTADYIRLFSIGCPGSTVLDYPLAKLNRPAPVMQGPEVVEENLEAVSELCPA